MEVLYKKTLHKVSLAVRLLDDFTGKPLSGSGYRFFVNDVQVRPVVKTDGYFVITGLQWDTYSLKITSPWYCTKEIHIAASRENSELRIQDSAEVQAPGTAINDLQHKTSPSPLDIRLYPGSAYPMLSGVTVYCGIFSSNKLKSPEGISVKLMSDLAGGRIKLKSIDKASSAITLQNPDGKDLTGMTISPGGEEPFSSMESIELVERLEGNTYKTGAGLQKSYPLGTPLFRVYRSFTDSRGKVLIPVESSTQSEWEVFVEASSGETGMSGKRLLSSGKTTTYHEVL